jgi:glyoxylase-like metal-dependent hydrolase (beta-lactamase superfamily II)
VFHLVSAWQGMSGPGTTDRSVSETQVADSVAEAYDQVRRALGVSDGGATGGVSHPSVDGVAPGVRVVALRTPTLPPATHTACYLVGPSEGAGELFVVDPASPYADQQAALDAILDREIAAGRHIAGVLLTHHHADHVGAAAHVATRDVPVMAHAETAARVRIPVSRVLADGDWCGPVRAVFTPGHAPGHLCFHDPASGALIAGDMVAGLGTILIDPSEGDMRQYLDSLAIMAALAPRMLLPAHGPMIHDAQGKLREYVAHRLMREGRVLEAVRGAGRATPAALVAVAYADTPKLLWGLAERSLVAHLVKLAADGRARREGDVWAAT